VAGRSACVCKRAGCFGLRARLPWAAALCCCWFACWRAQIRPPASRSAHAERRRRAADGRAPAAQERKAAVIRAEGESESARLISEATRSAGPGMIELRRIEAARDVASTLARSGSVVYLPGGNSNMLLGINPAAAGNR
jgi:hypothetical protein